MDGPLLTLLAAIGHAAAHWYNSASEEAKHGNDERLARRLASPTRFTLIALAVLIGSLATVLSILILAKQAWGN